MPGSNRPELAIYFVALFIGQKSSTALVKNPAR